MKAFKQLDRIGRIGQLLEQRRTGTPLELAGRLGVSRTSLYELLDELRSRGAPILYSKSEQTFYLKEPYEISVRCIIRPIKKDEQKDLNGGEFFPGILFFRTLESDLSIVTLPC